MKTYGLIFLTVTFLFGCAPGITRTGYDKSQIANYEINDCKVAIKLYFKTNSDDHIILGKIASYEQGLSVACNEWDILNIFVKEACALKADIINIDEAKYPDFWSTCYRAKAEFIKVKDPAIGKTIVSDKNYSYEEIVKRVARYDKEIQERLQRGIDAGIKGGILGGMMSSPK